MRSRGGSLTDCGKRCFIGFHRGSRKLYIGRKDVSQCFIESWSWFISLSLNGALYRIYRVSIKSYKGFYESVTTRVCYEEVLYGFLYGLRAPRLESASNTADGQNPALPIIRNIP